MKATVEVQIKLKSVTEYSAVLELKVIHSESGVLLTRANKYLNPDDTFSIFGLMMDNKFDIHAEVPEELEELI